MGRTSGNRSAATISPRTITIDGAATGAVAQLRAPLKGPLTWSKLSGASAIAIANSGAVTLSAAIGAGGSASATIRVQNGSGDALEKTITLAGVVPLATPTPAPTPATTYPAAITGFELGYNVPPANYYIGTPRRNNWALYCEIRDGGTIMAPRYGITGTGRMRAPSGTVLTSSSSWITFSDYNAVDNSWACVVTGDASGDRSFGYTGTKPAWIEVTRTGRPLEGTSTEWLDSIIGDGIRDLDSDWTNGAALTGVTPRPVRGVDRMYPITTVGAIEPYQDVIDSIRDLLLRRGGTKTFNYWHVIAPDLTDQMWRDWCLYARDTLPTWVRFPLEWCNEWPWNGPFQGPKRVMLDGVRHGWYGAATFGNPQPGLSVNALLTSGPGYETDQFGNRVTGHSPATPTGGLIAYNRWGIGYAIFRAKRNVQEGADVAVGDDWEVLPGMDLHRSARIWGSIRFNELLVIAKEVFGQERYDAQIFPVRMGQESNVSLADQFAVEKTFVPGYWPKIKGAGAGGYWSSEETNNAATTEQAILDGIEHRLPHFYEQLAIRYAQVQAEGKTWCQYEFALGPSNEHEYYNGNGQYRTRHDSVTRSPAIRRSMAAMAAFRRQFPGIFMYFTLVGQEPWSLKVDPASTTDNKLVGWLEGLAPGYVPELFVPLPEGPYTPPVPPSAGYRYFRFTPKKAGGQYGQTPDLQYYRVGAGEIVFKQGSTALSQAGYSASTESTPDYGTSVLSLVDGNPATAYNSSIGGSVNAGRFVIDTGAGIAPTSVDIYEHPGAFDFSVNSCTVEASRDGATWVQVADVAIDGLVYVAGIANLPLTIPS